MEESDDQLVEVNFTQSESLRSLGEPPLSLWDSAKQSFDKIKIKPGSLRASTLTVITSMVGGGVLALPHAFQQSGVIAGTIYFCILSLFAGYSVHVLIVCAHRSNCLSYHSLAVKSVGHNFGIFIEILLIFNLFGVIVAYQTLVRNILPLAVKILVGDHFWDQSVPLLVGFTILIVAPLGITKGVGALRYGSLVGCCLSIYLTIVTIVVYSNWCDTDKLPSRCIGNDVWSQVSLIQSDWHGHMYTIPLVLSCFAAHPTVLPIYVELQARDPKRMNYVILSGFLISLIIYISLSLFGYLSFGEKVEKNYLLNDYSHNWAVVLGAIGLAFVCLLACPLFLHAIRKSMINLYFLIRQGDPEKSATSSKGYAQLNENGPQESINSNKLSQTPVLAYAQSRPNRTESMEKSENAPESQVPYYAVIAVTLVTLTLSTLLAIFCDNIGTVLSLLGCTSVPFCCYIYPAMLCYLLPNVKATIWMKISSTFLAILVTCVSGVSLYVWFYTIIN